MLASEIITAARDISNLSVAQKSDALILPYLNMANKKLTQEVNSFLSEDSYSNIFTGDLVAGQEEYTIPKITATDDGAFSVSGVSVNYAPQVLQLGTATFTTGSNVVTGVNTTFGCKP